MRLQFLALLTARLTAIALQAITVAVLARHIGLHTFGVFGIVTSLALVGGTLIDLGMSTAIVQARATGHGPMVHSIVRLSRIVTLISTLLSVALLAPLTAGSSSTPWLPILVAGLLVERNVETLLGIAIADGDRVVPNVNIVGRRVGTTVGALVGVAANATHLLTTYAIVYLLVSLLAQVHVGRAIRPAIVGIAALPVRNAFSFCLPYWISNLTVHVRFFDVSIVGALQSPSAAGLYSAAQRLVTPLLIIPQTLTTVLLPHAAKNSWQSARAMSYRLTKLAAVATVALAPIYLVSDDLMRLVFGPAFAAGGATFAITLIAMPTLALSSMLGSVLQAHGYQRFVSVNGIAFAVVTIVALALAAALQPDPAIVSAALGATFGVKCASLLVRIARVTESQTYRTTVASNSG